MPEAAAPAAQPQQGGLIPQWLSSGIRFLFFYYVMTSLASRFLGGGGNSNLAVLNNTSVNSTSTISNNNAEAAKLTLRNTWSMSTPYSLEVYLSESNTTFGNWLVYSESDFRYDWSDSNTRETNITFKTNEYLQNNGSLFAHIVVNNRISPSLSLKTVHPMNVYGPKPKPKGKNLMSNEETIVEEPYDPSVLVSYWKPSLTVNLIVDSSVYGPGSIPPEILPLLNITGDRFTPVLYVNEFWVYKDQLSLINNTVDELTFSFSTYPLSIFKWQLYLQMQKSLDMQSMLGGTDDTGDDFKRMLTETNPYLLGLTFVVTMLHTVFEFLAFKNDIQFWKENKSMDGLSVRTIILHAVCSVIVFLYLWDNETSYLILFSSGLGILIEFWKIGKAMIVSVNWNGPIPTLSFKNKDSYTSKTKQYDDMAMKYLSWALFPLVIGTSIYSLYYYEHKSWYSWVISSLVRTVYTFEFIMMTPQLFINYKLKSVSRLPFKVFMYRALNTFIDDLFAFIIKMPLMHRLSCLRDDIIFIVYLYQRWIYPVDNKRSHYGAEDDGDESDKKKEDEKTIKDKKDEEKEEDEAEAEEKTELIEEKEEKEETTSSSKSTGIKKRTKKAE